jgi:hypothetical protein
MECGHPFIGSGGGGGGQDRRDSGGEWRPKCSRYRSEEGAVLIASRRGGSY